MSTTCYSKLGSSLYYASDVYGVPALPCPNNKNAQTGAQGCCAQGDACLEDGMCFFTHTSPGGSGYYMQVGAVRLELAYNALSLTHINVELYRPFLRRQRLSETMYAFEVMQRNLKFYE
jgi:hypothetical protein